MVFLGPHCFGMSLEKHLLKTPELDQDQMETTVQGVLVYQFNVQKGGLELLHVFK